MHKLPVLSGVFVAAALAVAACGGNSPAASNLPTVPGAIASLLPNASQLAGVPSALASLLPNASQLALGSGLSSDNHADPTLEGRYPRTIGGQPVTHISSYRLSDFVQLLAIDNQQKATAFLGTLAGAGLDASTMSFGSGTATVNDNDVGLDSVHTPGADASRFVSLWPQLAALDNSAESPPTLTNQSIGGKNVTVVTDPDGTVTYVYPQGDILWSFQSDDPTEAATVLQGLP